MGRHQCGLFHLENLPLGNLQREVRASLGYRHSAGAEDVLEVFCGAVKSSAYSDEVLTTLVRTFMAAKIAKRIRATLDRRDPIETPEWRRIEVVRALRQTYQQRRLAT